MLIRYIGIICLCMVNFLYLAIIDWLLMSKCIILRNKYVISIVLCVEETILLVIHVLGISYRMICSFLHMFKQSINFIDTTILIAN